MSNENDTIETAHAWLERSGSLVIQRWKPGITLDVDTIKETMLIRHKHFGDRPYVMIVVVPEGSAFAMSFLEHDQYEGTDVERSIIAMANVAEEDEMHTIISLYYAQHPPQYKHGVFSSMAEAKAWVKERLAERGE